MTTKNIVLLFLVFGLILLSRLFLFFTNFHAYDEGQIVKFSTRLSSAPKNGLDYQQVSFTLPNHQRGFTRLPEEPILSYGDQVEISGVVSYIDTASGSKLLSLKYPQFRIISKDNSPVAAFRSRVVKFFSHNLNQNQASLMLGIVFGIKQDFSANFRQNIQNTGLLHVVAASGMNITMLGGFFSAFLGFLFSRRLSIVLTISIIAFYAVLAGLEPSIIRASIMGILVFTAQLLGRQSTAFVGLSFAAFFMLMLDPALLLDTGFQLSFMATFGLVFFRPIFLKISKAKNLIEKSVLGEDFLTTITAQIFTLPILVLSFGSYSPLSILSNMLVLWTVPILMVIGGLAVVIGIFIEPIGRLILIPSIPLLEFFTKLVNWFGQRASIFTFQNLPFSIVLGYYLILFSFIIGASKKEKERYTYRGFDI